MKRDVKSIRKLYSRKALTGMTEQQWLSTDNVHEMISFLERNNLLTNRKARLFAVACASMVRHLMNDERSRRAIDVAERFAEGTATREELRDAWRAADRVAWGALRDVAGYAAWSTAESSAWGAAWNAVRGAERKVQAHLLRSIFGNPFKATTIPPHALTWNNGTVRLIAQQIYENNEWDRLPILADAMEEAGCEDDKLLNDMRTEGHYARGHHVVDKILGKV